MKWVVQTLEGCSLAEVLEGCSLAEVSKEFIKTLKAGNNAFIALRSSNLHGWYLTFVEYRRGGNRDIIIIPEERDGKGWRKLEMEHCALCFCEGHCVEKV